MPYELEYRLASIYMNVENYFKVTFLVAFHLALDFTSRADQPHKHERTT
jgi:hypothetical protein